VSAKAHIQLHASCVAFGETAILLRGPSGSGKSDLALRLIDRGAALVADDRVDLRRDSGRLRAAPPPTLAGLLEIRGVGIVRTPFRANVAVGLLVDLVAAAAVERLPEPASEAILGLRVIRLALDPFAASTPAKIAAALRPGAVLAVDDAASAA
jgi:serine kinase of HPr protein (carbohydrate metabolism regulator)